MATFPTLTSCLKPPRSPNVSHPDTSPSRPSAELTLLHLPTALYVHLQGGAGESARLHKGGLGAQINGTMKATPGAVLWIYAGAGQPNEDRVQAGRGVFWGSGGGYSSIGEGKANGHSESEIGGHCFKHAQHGNQGDCRLLVAAGGGGAGPGGDGDPAGTSKLGMRQDMYGESPEDGASGGGGGGYLGGKVWQGHGGGGGAMRLGPGHFTTLYRTASPSTTAFVSIRASCVSSAFVPSTCKIGADPLPARPTVCSPRLRPFCRQAP